LARDEIDSIEAKPAKAALEAGSMLSPATPRLSARSVSRVNMCAVSPAPEYTIALEIANMR
jgi:hypothetical protein